MLWTVSGELIIMVMIGGLGTLAGPVIGGAFFVLLQEKVSSYVDWYFMVIGLVLIFIVLFMPRGLLGIRELLGGRPMAHDGLVPGGRRRLQELRRARGALEREHRRAGRSGILGDRAERRGKSTLFNVVSGLHVPTAGRVRFRGREIGGLAPETINRLGVAKTFQITNIFPEISVFEKRARGRTVARPRVGTASHPSGACPTSRPGRWTSSTRSGSPPGVTRWRRTSHRDPVEIPMTTECRARSGGNRQAARRRRSRLIRRRRLLRSPRRPCPRRLVEEQDVGSVASPGRFSR